MRLFTCTDHDTHWPVGGASVILAESEAAARVILDQELLSQGLKPSSEKPYELVERSMHAQFAYVLNDGNY